MTRARKALLSLIWFGAALAVPALADVPTQMPVQGRLTNLSGSPVPVGLKLFTFKIFDAEVGGTEIWPAGPGETQTLTSDANGLWNGSVGKLLPLTPAVFQSPVRWLQITVDDGINPAETLPRLELKTSPYTFRAASSEQADSLGGSSLSDLANQFVDEAADTMSGPLRIDWSHSGGQSALEVSNIANGYSSTWSDGSGHWGAILDANADNDDWNIGLGAAAQGDNTSNYGLYGIARGTGSFNLGVLGEASGGSSNIAGLFDGDLWVTGASAGDASVSLPASAISSAEILDEPGIASSQATGSISFTDASPTDMVDVLTVTITTPADGYVSLHASGYVWTTGTAGENGLIYIQIDEAAAGSFTDPYYRLIGELTKPAANTFHAFSVDRIFFKAAGSYTFRLEARRAIISAGVTVNVYNRILTATFYPRSYGTVATVVSAQEAGDFEASNRIDPSNAESGLKGAPAEEAAYLVDLRELELKAARAEEEAAKARRELLEAHSRLAPAKSPAPEEPGE